MQVGGGRLPAPQGAGAPYTGESWGSVDMLLGNPDVLQMLINSTLRGIR